MKKLWTGVLLCGALLSLTACGSSDNNKEKELQATIDSQSKEIKDLKEKNSERTSETFESDSEPFSEYKAIINTKSYKILHDTDKDTEFPNVLSFKAKITNNSKELLPFSDSFDKIQVENFFSATQESPSSVYDLSALMWNMEYASIKMKPNSSKIFEFHFSLKNTKDKVMIISDYMDKPVTVDVSKLKVINEQ